MKRVHFLWYNHGDKNMIINPNSTVVVYQIKEQKYYKSVYSKFEILIQEYKMVGYIEDLGVLCCGFETVYYDMNQYVKDIMSSDFDEMTYEEYIKYYQGKLAKDNPGAPMLNDAPPITFGAPQINELEQAPMQREILNSSTSRNTSITIGGAKVNILRG